MSLNGFRWLVAVRTCCAPWGEDYCLRRCKPIFYFFYFFCHSLILSPEPCRSDQALPSYSSADAETKAFLNQVRRCCDRRCGARQEEGGSGDALVCC